MNVSVTYKKMSAFLKWKDINEMSKEELKEELLALRKLWEWTPDEVKLWVGRIGKLVVAVRRDYTRMYGNLAGIGFDVSWLDLEMHDKVFRHDTGTYWFERKYVHVDKSSIIQTEEITEQTESTQS